MNAHKTNMACADTTSNDIEDRLFDFLELSQKIRTIIAHENAILETCGCLSLDAYLAQKNTLLQTYEAKATLLCADITKTTCHSEATKDLLIEEIASVKETLSDNTQRQFNSIENILLGSSGDTSWH